MSIKVNKLLSTVSTSNTNGISPLTMPDGKENDKMARGAADGDGGHMQLNETVKELFIPASPKEQKPDEEYVFSPSQLHPSQIELVGGRRRARIIFGEQDPEKNPELFTPPRKV